MSTFEITIERKMGNRWPVLVERTSPGASLRLRAEGTLLLGPEAEQALLAAVSRRVGRGGSRPRGADPPLVTVARPTMPLTLGKIRARGACKARSALIPADFCAYPRHTKAMTPSGQR